MVQAKAFILKKNTKKVTNDFWIPNNFRVTNEYISGSQPWDPLVAKALSELAMTGEMKTTASVERSHVVNHQKHITVFWFYIDNKKKQKMDPKIAIPGIETKIEKMQ